MRKMSKERALSASLADDFNGLPLGIHHLKVWDWINDARRSLSLKSDHVTLLGYYIKRTRAIDWTRGHEPIVAWAKFEVCYDLDWSEDKLSRIENDLCSMGLIAYRDSSNCKRRAYRDSEGVMSDNSAGISLAPVGTRALEISALAHQQNADKRKLASIYSQIFELRPIISSFQEHPELPSAIADTIRSMLAELPRRKHHNADLSLMERLLKQASDMIVQLRSLLGFPPVSNEQENESGHEEEAISEAPQPVKAIRPAADLRTLHRRSAVHKDPHYNKPKEDQNLVDLLAASPESFRITLEVAQERGGGSAWENLLSEAMDAYGRDLALNKSFVGRLKSQFGISQTLSALFGLGKMAEKGAEIRNPAGYALSLARSRPQKPAKAIV